TNTGPVPVTNIGLADNTPADADFAWQQCTAANGTVVDMTAVDAASKLAALTLLPGDIVTCTATSKVTQLDLDYGFQVVLEIDVTASSVTQTGQTSTATGSGAGVIELTQHAALALTKTADKTTAKTGELVTFTITAVNTGNTTLVDVAVTDDMKGLSPMTCAWPGETGTLKVGENVVCTTTYTVTAADAANGTINNEASVSGKTPGSPSISTPAGTEIEAQSAGTSVDTEVAVTVSLVPSGGQWLADGATSPWLAPSLLVALCGLAVAGCTILRRRQREEG
ncbi:MAG: DUF11 domain-containing protein, partial [Propionibacteriaceae bacterium]|nr:DUF11 domain-containing protein [Propionibacteriaceae bacterium]